MRRIAVSYFIVLAAIIAASPFPILGQEASQVDDLTLLLRQATSLTIRHKKKVEPIPNGQLLLRLATDSNSKYQKLASLTISRTIIQELQQNKQTQFGKDFAEAVEVMRGATAGTIARQSIDELLGNEPATLDGYGDLASQLIATVNQGIETQKMILSASRAYWECETLVYEEIKRIQSQGSPKLTNLKDLFRVVPNSHKIGRQAFAAFDVFNESDTTISSAVVLIRIDCAYTANPASRNSTIFGQLLVEALAGESSPDYVGRDDAITELANVPKCAVYLVENWSPEEVVKLVALDAPEYFHTAKTLEFTVFLSDKYTTEMVNIDDHKRSLYRKFAPRR